MLKIYSWNVNGIRAVMRKGVFEPFLKEHDPDILCLQETKATRGQVDIDLPGYEEYWNSANRKGYSGTAIFSKIPPLAIIEGFPEDIQKAHDLATDDYGDPNAEGRVITAEFETFYLVGVYTPNSKTDLSRIPLRHGQWDPAFLAYCKGLESGSIQLDRNTQSIGARLDAMQGEGEQRTDAYKNTQKEQSQPTTQQSAKSTSGVSSSARKQARTASFSGKPVIFCGDLNVAHTENDLARPKENDGKKGFTQEEREGFQSFLDAGFIDTFRLFHEGNGYYTWWTHWAKARERNVGWRIDYVLVSEALRDKVKDAQIHPEVMGSDHCPVSLTIDI